MNMQSSVPASFIAGVNPSVLGAGGTGLSVNGIVLTASSRVPMGVVMPFASADAVGEFFGLTSDEYGIASRYFPGFDVSTIKPAQIFFMQYATAAVPGYLQGGNVANLSLAALQAITGTVILTIGGDVVTSSAIVLTSANSFSAAAALIQTALNNFDATVTASIAANTLTVTALTAGELAVGQVISGTGVTAGTKITALGTGTGGVGTYTVDTTQTVASTAIKAGPTTVAYDSVSGAFIVTGGTPGAAGTISLATGTAAAALALTAATGAVLSQGAPASTPAGAMTAATAATQNFVTFMTIFQPSIPDMIAFAAWSNAQNKRYLYVMGDSSVAPTTSTDTTSAGAAVKLAQYSGTMPIYDPISPNYISAFIMGAFASVDYSKDNGRTTMAYLTQAGLAAGVTDEQIAKNLVANGYNFYIALATAAEEFTFFYPGSVSGPYLWADSYVNQVYLTNDLQLAIVTLMMTMRLLPYNAPGYALIEQGLADPIQSALDFGTIQAGVTLSSIQAAAVNTAAGVQIDQTITQRGWYLQVAAASAQVRAARASPPITLWYTDGESIQTISLNSIAIQ